MAKGSKAWFEVYERKICEIEDEEDLGIMGEYSMLNMGKVPWSLDSRLLSSKAGCYSVSKLNILIGQFLFILWRFQHANAHARKVKEYFRKNTQKGYENLIFLLGDGLFCQQLW